MGYYRPRALIRLRVPVMGSESARLGQAQDRTIVEFNAPVVRARVTKNDFNVADEAEVEVSYDQIGVDPRLLSNAILYVFMGDAPSSAPWVPDLAKDLRFLGVTNSVRRKFDGSKKTIEIKALDYTTLFIGMKPYPAEFGTPSFTHTLRQAWGIVCDNVGFYDFTAEEPKITSSVGDLRSSIVGVGEGGVRDDTIIDTPIGSSMIDRIAQLGKIQIHPDEDAWSAWRVCVDSMGLLTWIDRDVCYVSRAPDYYSARDPAVFVYGLNVKEIEEERDVGGLNNKGVHMTCYDPVFSHTIESFFPARTDSRFYKKRLTAANRKKPTTAAAAPVTDYEHFVYPYSINQEALNAVAQRVWEERSRQELQGKISTAEMAVKSASGKTLDVLGVNHGDQIVVKLDQLALDELRSLPTDFARSYYLLERGFAAGTAALIARDQGFLSNLLAQYVVREVTLEYDADAETFQVQISYCSRLNPNTGDADTSTT